jgi:hypothetical protein
MLVNLTVVCGCVGYYLPPPHSYDIETSKQKHLYERGIDMTSSDRLLRQLLKAIEAHNRYSQSKISQLEALRLYLEMTKAGR